MSQDAQGAAAPESGNFFQTTANFFRAAASSQKIKNKNFVVFIKRKIPEFIPIS